MEEKKKSEEPINIPIVSTTIPCPKCGTHIDVAFDVELEGLMNLAKMQSALQKKKEADDKD